MTRLLIVAEGLSEVNFISQVLKPHLESHPERLTVSAPNLGGHHTYARLKKFIKSLLGSPGSPAIVTTMVDLFKPAGDFPRIADAADLPPEERVRQLEQCCTDDIGDRRFFAHSNFTSLRRCC